MSIAGRAITSLIHSQGIGNLYRIHSTTQRDRVDFNLAFIPPTFNQPHPEEFDNAYMRQLLAVGYEMALKGFPGPRPRPDLSLVRLRRQCRLSEQVDRPVLPIRESGFTNTISPVTVDVVAADTIEASSSGGPVGSRNASDPHVP